MANNEAFDAMTSHIAYDALTLDRLVARHARYRSRHLALVAPRDGADARLSWSELDAYVNRVANAFAHAGVRRGDRVATLLANSLELVGTYWACAKLGAAVVPLSPLLNAPGIASLLRDASPRLLLAPRERLAMLNEVRRDLDSLAPTLIVVGAADAVPDESLRLDDVLGSAAAPEIDVHADDVWTVMYSSGTTGLPKGILHTHFIRAMYATLFANAWRITPDAVVLHTGALVFNGAMVTMLPAFLMGATFVTDRVFDAGRFVDIVERERVTHTMLVPSQIVAIMDAPGFDPARLESLQMILSLGAPLHREHRERLMRILPGRFHELYGLTEGFVTILDRDDAARKPGSVGVPPPFYEMRIVDDEDRDVATGEVGEIVGRGPITTPGYLGRDTETHAALRGGWLRTGDLGRVDEDGFLYLVDRKKDMIDSGGVKVYPRDIEEVAAQHPSVREVAVFGIPHARWGETPCAAIVLRPGAELSADDLRSWINARVAARYQRIDRVVLCDDFPRNAAGKTLKRELRAVFWQGREGAI